MTLFGDRFIEQYTESRSEYLVHVSEQCFVTLNAHFQFYVVNLSGLRKSHLKPSTTRVSIL